MALKPKVEKKNKAIEAVTAKAMKEAKSGTSNKDGSTDVAAAISGVSQPSKKTLDVLKVMTAKLGVGAAFAGSSGFLDLPVIKTGIATLDFDIGGVPEGRITELFGPEGSGKSSLCLTIVKAAQTKYGSDCGIVYIDVEQGLDMSYAKKIGVEVNDIVVVQPDCGETALAAAEAAIESGLVKVVVIDSVAALVPRDELEGKNASVGKGAVGTQARMMSAAMRQLIAKINRMKVTVIFINQLREKVGIMYGSPETTPGGNALKFYCSLRMRIQKTELIKDGDQVVGQTCKVRVLKNRSRPPFREPHMDLYFGVGFNEEASILTLAEKLKIVTKAGGGHYSMGDRKLGQGESAMTAKLKEDKELKQILLDAIQAEDDRLNKIEVIDGPSREEASERIVIEKTESSVAPKASESEEEKAPKVESVDFSDDDTNLDLQ